MQHDRLAILTAFPDEELAEARLALYRAMVRCLDIQTVCALAVVVLDQDEYKRRGVLAKLRDDMSAGWGSAHGELIMAWIGRIQRGDYREAMRACRCIRHVFDLMPTEIQITALRAMCGTRWRVPRCASYRTMSQSWKPEYSDLLLELWSRYHDPEAVALIALQLPLEVPEHERPVLESELYGRTLVAYVERLGELQSEAALARVRTVRPIAYAYVLAKLNRKFEEAEAVRLYLENRSDERIGLLLWSYGQMGLWGALERIHDLILAETVP